ncbi:MAG: sporulation protein YqfD [Clostridia bacterium]
MAGIIWNYLAGYVIIQIKGLALERFINLAVQSGVEMWNVKRTGAAAVTAYVSVAGFYALHKLVRGLDLSITILKKHGLPITLSQFRFRKVLLYGWIAVIALIIAASRCIWLVEINGCDIVPKDDVMQILSAMQVGVGTPRHDISTSKLGKTIMQSDQRIAWAGASIEGVVLTINVAEADEDTAIVNDDTPASVYAQMDGMILDIVALSGKAMVKPGDVVKKGDLLINGDLSTDEMKGIYVCARGSVTAKVLYVFTADKGPKVTTLARTGNSEQGKRVSLLGMTLMGHKWQYKHYEETMLDRCQIKRCFLPIDIYTMRCFELDKMEVSPSKEHLEVLALTEARTMIATMIPKDATITAKQSRTEQKEDGAVRAIITITTEEDIGEAKRLFDE